MFSLLGKTALVFAATGEIATAVSHSLAEQGATVYLSARRLESVQQLANAIEAKGGKAFAHQLDATNEEAIEKYLTELSGEVSSIDITFNGIGLRAEEAAYGRPITEISFKHFMMPLQVILGAQFLTTRAVAKRMIAYGQGGTILTLTASVSRIKMGNMAGLTSACAAIEGLTRSLAAELGPHGIRVICINPTAIKESRTIRETSAAQAAQIGVEPEVILANMDQSQLLGYGPKLIDIGRLAAFLASNAGAILNSHVIDADFGNTGVI